MSLRTYASLLKFVADQHGVFTTAEAAQHLVTERQLAGLCDEGVVDRVLRGVYRFTSTPISTKLWLAAATKAGGETSFAAGRSAALLLELPGQREDLIEISAPKGSRPQHRFPHLVVHESKRILPGDIRIVNGLRCARPERVIVDLAAVCHSRIVEQAFHAARRQRLLSYPSMVDYLERYARRGRNGCGVVREMLERHNADAPPTESILEHKMLSLMRGAGLPEPDRQVVVTDHVGRVVGRADFGYESLKIILLTHSRQWHATAEDVEKDESQRNRYWSAGWIPIIARTDDIANGGQEFLAAFREARSLRSKRPVLALETPA